MSSIVSCAPTGFSSAIARLNQLPVNVVDSLGNNVLEFVLCKSGAISTTYAKNVVPDASDEDLKNSVNVLIYLFKSFLRQKTPLEEVGELLMSLFDKDKAVVLGRAWKNLASGSSSSSNNLKNLLSVGTLVDLKWKCGVAIQSSKSVALNSPYVTLLLSVADSNGIISDHSMELSIPEFQEVVKHFNNISDILKGM